MRLKIDAKKEKKRSSLCVRYNRARFLRRQKKRLLSQNDVKRDTIERANERTNERTKSNPPEETLLRQRTSFNLSTASNAARPLVVDPEPPEPPLEEDEDEGRPDDALEEEGLPNSLLNMMNMMRGRIGFFFVREKRCLPFHKEEGEKTREKTRKDFPPLAVLVYVVFVVLLNAPAPETTRAFFFFGCAGFVRRFSFPFSSSSRLFVFAE